jgi:5''-3'' exonuclease (including N-terminal domain of PolI)
LLNTYGTLENVLDHAAEIKGKLGETLLKSRDIAMLSRELATIDRDAPIDCTLKDLEFQPVYSAEVKSKLAEYELTSLISRMKFSDDDAKATEKKDFKKCIKELSDLKAVEKALDGNSVALLIGKNVSFSTDGKTEYVVVCGDDLFAALNFDSAVECVVNNLKGKQLICYDYKSMSKTYGFEADDFFDVMIAAHLARGSAPIKSLDAVLGAEGMETGAAELFTCAKELKNSADRKKIWTNYFIKLNSLLRSY